MVGLCTEALMYFMCNKAALVWFPQSSPNYYLLWVLFCSYLSSQSFVLASCTSVRQGRRLGTDRKSGELKKGGGTELGSLLAAFMATRGERERERECVCVCVCQCVHPYLTSLQHLWPLGVCVCVCVCVCV